MVGSCQLPASRVFTRNSLSFSLSSGLLIREVIATDEGEFIGLNRRKELLRSFALLARSQRFFSLIYFKLRGFFLQFFEEVNLLNLKKIVA